MALTVPADTTALRQIVREAYTVHETIWRANHPDTNYRADGIASAYDTYTRCIAMIMGAEYPAGAYGRQAAMDQWQEDLTRVRSAFNHVAADHYAYDAGATMVLLSLGVTASA